MSWYKKVNEYIDENLLDFIKEFYGDGGYETQKISKSIRVNPCPSCGHKDCFSFATEINGFNCFSCRVSGNRLNSLSTILNLSDEDIRKRIFDWSGIDYIPNHVHDQQVQKEREHNNRIKMIHELAIKLYSLQLSNQAETKALYHQTEVRKHQAEFLEKYQVGYSVDQRVLRNALEKSSHNFTQEEIKEALKLVGVPEGFFVYPYFDKTGNLIRVNAKLHERICMGNQRQDGTFEFNCGYRTNDLSKKAVADHKARPSNKNHVLSSDGFSRGEKIDAFYYAKGTLRRQKFAILLEGENDVISVDEALSFLPQKYQRDFLPIGLGGQMDEASFDSLFLRQFDAIYECFDHDEAGDKYRELLDEKLPDIPVYSIKFDEDYNDIDEYLKSGVSPDVFKDAIDNAEYRETHHFIINRDTKSHKWTLVNRKYEIVFDILRYNSKKGFPEGTISVNKGGQPVFEKDGDLASARLDNYLNTPKLLFARKLKEYYQSVEMTSKGPQRSFEELIDIYPYTPKKNTVVKHLSIYLANKDEKDFEIAVKRLAKLGSKVRSQILQEVNSSRSDDIKNPNQIPEVTLSQFFSVQNDDAFFYFTKFLKDDEEDTNETKKLPFLLTNKKEEIRLDLIKRKTPQSVLLVKKKYQLPSEVPTAIMDPDGASLQQEWAEKWRLGQLKPEEYAPSKLIQEIEEFINRCYYLEPDTVKVLSLWIYATYFYTIFKAGFPYLLITGEKGTGKTTADMLIYLLSLNAKLALQMSESALFRAISQQGGTFILDEIENLSDKKNVDNNAMATILKGGYSDTGKIYRTNMDQGSGGNVEGFSAFGPKVISNINGLDDVIGDRCIFIKTIRAPESKIQDLEDVQFYRDGTGLEEVKAITSKCVISALTYFKEVYDLYYNPRSKISTGNARLSQIVKPLMTMAQFVGEDYEEALMRFYKNEISPVKEELSVSSLEGMVKHLIRTVALELTGISTTKWATLSHESMYPTPIEYHEDTGIFQMDIMHFFTLAEASNNDTPVELNALRKTIKQTFKNQAEYMSRSTKRSVGIADEGLQRRLNGKKRMLVDVISFNVNDYLTDAEKEMMNPNRVPEKSLF